MNNLECIWRQPHLLLATKLRLCMTLIVPMLLRASETWTSTKAGLNHLQAFHMRCQRHILGVRWFHKIKNAYVTLRTGLIHISDLSRSAGTPSLATSPAWIHRSQLM